MRISLTDRCNLRCVYCMPHGIELARREEVLREDEIVEVASCAAALGICHFKLTGGEPLVRRCCRHVAARIKRLKGVRTVTLTTNGMLLKENLRFLKESGIDGINISLDTTDPERYRALTGGGDISTVLDAIEASVKSGIPTKINTVLLRETIGEAAISQYPEAGNCRSSVENDDTHNKDVNSGYPDEGKDRSGDIEIPDVASLAREYPVDVRFIEMMPIGSGRDYPPGDSRRLLKALQTRYPQMKPDLVRRGNGPAVYYSIPGFLGDIGFISAIHGKFCASCNRVRLTSMGYLKTCLAYEDGTDLRRILRDTSLSEKTREARICEAIQEAVCHKPKAHCFEDPAHITETHAMASIGG